jgi:hypothetical protein
VLLWEGDTTLGLAGYEVNFYLKTSTRDHYTKVGNSQLPNVTNNLLFKPLRSQCVCPIVAHPDYTMPVPWVP